MEILDKVVSTCKNVASKVKEVVVKAKDHALSLALGGSAMLGATSAKADGITFDSTTGFSGSISTLYFFSAVAIIVTFLGVAIAIGYGLRTLKAGGKV